MSDDELAGLVDGVLRTGKHAALPKSLLTGGKTPDDERHHARVIATQIQQLASSLGGPPASPEVPKEQWYFEVDGKQVGPVDLPQVQKLWEDGEIGPDSFCWHDGFSTWIPLSKVTQLAAAIAPRETTRPVPPLIAARDEEASAWKPHADALRTALPEPAPPPAPKPAPAPISPAGAAGPSSVLAAPPPAPVVRSSLAHSVVTGAVAGLVVAAALLIARALIPAPAPAPAPTPAAPPPSAAAPVEPIPPAPPEPQLMPEPAPAAEPPAAEAPPAHDDTDPSKREIPTEVPPPPKLSVYIPPAPASPEVPERLGQADVLAVAAAHRSDIQRCIDRHRPADEPEGRITLRWTIHPDGTTSGASVTSQRLRDSELARCFLGLVAQWTFPKHAAQMDPVEIPFAF